MKCRTFFVLWLGTLTVASAAAQGTLGGPPAQNPASAIAEVGVNFGLNLKRPPTPGEREYLSVLFDAALQLDPNLALAHRGRFELAQLSNAPEALSKAINTWFESAPHHAGLAASWLEEQSRQWHTSEARERGLLEIIARATTSDYVKGLAYVRLARLAHERLDTERYASCLDNAVNFLPNHPEAVLARFEMLTADAKPAKRLRRALEVLTLNPVHVEAAWEAGLALQDGGLPDEAATFFEHAEQVFRTVRPQAVAPAIYHVHLAENHLARDQLPDAVSRLRMAIALDPSRVETAFLLLWTLDQAGLHGARDRLQETLAQRFGRIRDPQRWPVAELMQAAWYHITVDPQPERALLLAKAAAEQAPRDAQAQRILGFAHELSGDEAQARELLRQIADRDMHAAVWLGNADLKADNEAAARRWLDPYIDSYPVGPLGGQLNELRIKLAPPEPEPEETTDSTEQAEPTTEEAADPNAPSQANEEAEQPDTTPKRRLTPAQAELESLRSSFNFKRLTYFRQPAEFVELGVRFADPTRAPGEPWWVEVTLRNRSAAPFMLGPDGAFNSVVALSLDVVGQRTLAFPNLLTVTFDQTRLLEPGVTLTEWRRIDVGPVRTLLQRNPRLLIRATANAVLDPVENVAGQWVPGVTGQRHEPVYLSRAPFVPSVEALDLLIRRLQGDQRPLQWSALSQISTLLGEQQRARLDTDGPSVPRIPTDRLITPLRGLLESEITELRVAALLALDAAGLNAYLLEAVERCLEHDDWTVRMLATRVLARRGSAAQPQLEKLAQTDAQPLVRRMATALAQRLSEAEQPAETE